MPSSVVAAVAADAIATAVADAVIFDLVAATTLDWVATYAVIQAGTSFIAGAAIRGALSGGQEDAPTATPAFTAQAQQRTHVIRSSVANRTIVYGRCMVSGPLVFAATSEDNDTLYLVVALAGHEVEEIEDIYFNDESIGTLDGSGNPTTGKYAGYATIKKHLGTADQTADADLVAANVGWTADHRLRGVAYLYAELTWSRDVYPRGIPNIKAIVKGKKLYDPRSGLTAYSATWALAVRDYLAGSYGLACTSAEINDTAVSAAANISDEAVALAAGGTEARYTCNGVIDTGNTPKSNMLALLSGGAGTLTWPGGVYTLHAGAYVAPSVTLDADDLRGAIRVQPRPKRQDLYNAVKGTYVDPNQHWQPVDFPALENATYAAQDGGETIWRDVAYPVTTSAPTAQRLAKMALEKSRQGITVDMPCKMTAFKVAVWDNVQLTISHLGWSSKVFKTTGWRLSENGGVDLTLQEEASSCYSWSAEETAVDPAPDTNLPNPFSVDAPTGLALASGTDVLLKAGDGTIITRIAATWTQHPDGYVRSGGKIEIQYKRTADSAWQDWIPAPGDAVDSMIGPVEDGASYDVRIRALNYSGVRSAWHTVTGHTVIGKTARPADASNFLINGDTLTWNGVADDDLAGYLIRWQPGTNPSWGDAQPLHEGVIVSSPYTMLNRPSGPVTLMLKSVDTSGNESAGMQTIYTDLGDPVVANIIVSYDYHAAAFTGTRSNATVEGGTGDLIADADTSPLMWRANDAANMWGTDSTALMWVGTTYKAMSYTDGFTVAAADAGAQITIARTIDGTYALEWRPDGAAPMWGDPGALMWSNDAAALWTVADWTAWPGSVVAAAGSYEIRASIADGAVQGRIAALAVQFDVPDISEVHSDVAISGGGTRLTLIKTYRAIKVVNLTLQTGSGTALTARAIDKSATLGPLIKCFDSSNAATTGTVDAIIQGY